MPLDFGEHRYFCSLRDNVPIEKFGRALVRYARDMESNCIDWWFQEIRRRVRESCRFTEWQGGAGTLVG